MGLFGSGSHDHDSIIERLREIKRWLLGREESVLTVIEHAALHTDNEVEEIERAVGRVEGRLDDIEERLGRLEAQVQAILDAVGQPDEDLVAAVTFGPPSPKIPDGLLTAGPAPRPKFPTAHVAPATHAKHPHRHHSR